MDQRPKHKHWNYIGLGRKYTKKMFATWTKAKISYTGQGQDTIQETFDQ